MHFRDLHVLLSEYLNWTGNVDGVEFYYNLKSKIIKGYL